MSRKSMKNWNDDALLIVAEQTDNERTKKYIESILVERFNKSKSIIELYQKMKRNQNTRNDILWSSITGILTSDRLLIDTVFLETILKEMPMDYLALVAVCAKNDYIKALAREIGHAKQEEYEKEIGIYDNIAEKYSKDEVYTLKMTNEK